MISHISRVLTVLYFNCSFRT